MGDCFGCVWLLYAILLVLPFGVQYALIGLEALYEDWQHRATFTRYYIYLNRGMYMAISDYNEELHLAVFLGHVESD